MQRKIMGLMLAGLAIASLSLPGFADTSAKDAKDYRQAIMESMGGHIGAASMLLRGLVDDHGQLAAHAQGLANSASELKYVFPEGSNIDDSEALRNLGTTRKIF